MNPVAATIAELLECSRSLDSESPRLDVELLLACALGRNRAFLRAWPEHPLSAAQRREFAGMLGRRAAGEPMAYILGERDFWTMTLRVSPHTLIPRPETETLVQAVLDRCGGQQSLRILDLGTGSGAIALALASERPGWQLDAVDVDSECVAIAADNADRHGLSNVSCWCSDWFSAVDADYDLVVANPPYIAATDRHLQRGDVRFEPRRALVSADSGLAACAHIAERASDHLKPQGLLVMEHGYDQAQACRTLLIESGYDGVETVVDCAGQPRVTMGRWLEVPVC